MFGELVVQMAVGRPRHEIDRRPVRIHWMTRRQAEMNISEYIIIM